MASPYVAAMNHQEWATQRVLRRHHRNRPLGRIHDHYNYKPAQPVLSCRSPDIDVSGTRTYRARSANDIIEEQHKIIHQIYSAARNVSARHAATRTGVSSAPVPRGAPSAGAGGAGPLASVQVYGARPGSPRSRPHTAGNGRRQHPVPGVRRAKSSMDTHFVMRVDPDIQASTQAYKKVHYKVRDQWDNPERHALDEGQFVRTKKKETSSSIDAKTGSQWLRFGSGRSSSCGSGGVVAAFTEDETYHIDGTAASQVAKVLSPRDGVRVGRNGGPVPQLPPDSEHSDTGPLSPPLSPSVPPSLVPLCWEDQVEAPEVRVVSARGPHAPPPRPSLCETRPVVFGKPATNKPPMMIQKSRENTDGGYSVKMRSKPRKGVDGVQRQTTTITSITIDNSPTPEEETGETDGPEEAQDDEVSLSCQDILDMSITNKQETKKQQREAAAAAAAAAAVSIHEADVIRLSQTIEQQHPGDTAATAGPARGDTGARQPEPAAPQPPAPAPPAAAVTEDTCRPMTGISHISLQGPGECADLMVGAGSGGVTARSSVSTPPTPGPAARGNRWKPMSATSARGRLSRGSSAGCWKPSSSATSTRGGRQVSSAGRPPPQKPTLHKTLSASSAGGGGEPQYIHFSSHIRAPAGAGAGAASSGETPTIRKISDHNNPQAATGDLPDIASDRGGDRDDDSFAGSPRMLDDDDLFTPPSSPKLHDEDQEEVRYAFNIPTADMDTHTESERMPTEPPAPGDDCPDVRPAEDLTTTDPGLLS